MADTDVIVAFLADISDVQRKSAQMNREIAGVKQQAAKVSFGDAVKSMIPSAGVVMAAKAGLSAIGAGVSLFNAQQAKAIGNFDAMLDAEEAFKQGIQRIPVIGEAILGPLTRVYDQLSGSADRAAKLREHMQATAKATDMIAASQSDVSRRDTLLGVSPNRRDIVAAGIQATREFDKAISEAQKRLAEFTARTGEEYRIAADKERQLIANLGRARSEAHRVTMAEIIAEQAAKDKAAQTELANQLRVIRARRGGGMIGGERGDIEADRAGEIAAAKAKGDAALRKIDDGYQRILEARGPGAKLTDREREDRKERRAGVLEIQRSEVDAANKAADARIDGINAARLAEKRAADDAAMDRRKRLQDEIALEELRQKGQTDAAAIYEIDRRHAEALDQATSPEERRLVTRKRNLELEKLTSGGFGSKWTRLSEELRGGPRAAMLAAKEGDLRMTPRGLEMNKGGNEGWQPAGMNWQQARERIQQGTSNFFTADGQRGQVEQFDSAYAESIAKPQIDALKQLVTNTAEMIKVLGGISTGGRYQ